MTTPFPKSIKLFLIDGDPNGRTTAEISNWTGKAYSIPRTLIKKSSDRDELRSVGVYMLFGKDIDSGKDMVYIGETEDVFSRLQTHMDQKEFWNDSLIFISKDGNLNKAHIKYLEYAMYRAALTADRYKLENVNVPVQPQISEADIAEMEECFHNIQLLTNTLGFKVFEEEAQLPESASNTFHIHAARGADARGQPTTEGFVVLEGSQMTKDTVPSIQKWIIDLRDELLNDGTVQEIDSTYIFQRKKLFPSPSTAAAVIMGRNANGLKEWKLSDGTTLKQYESPN